MNTLLPLNRINRLFNLPQRNIFDRFLDDFNLPVTFNDEKEWLPKVDISETDHEYIVRAEVPGIEKDNINITLTDDLLTLRGEKKQETEEENECYSCVERNYGEFTRTLRLPAGVESEKVDANYKDGVLKIVLTKAEAAKTKKIEVH